MRKTHHLIHLAYLAVMSFGLAVLLFLAITLLVDIASQLYNTNWTIEFASSFGSLYVVAFYYMVTRHPFTPHTTTPPTPPQEDFFNADEQVENVYLLCNLLSSPRLRQSSVENINTYLESYLKDDELFNQLSEARTLAVLYQVLKSDRLSVDNQIQATRRLDELLEELMRLDRLEK